MGRYRWEDLKPEPQNTWETDLINSKLNHKDNGKINDNKQVIQKNQWNSTWNPTRTDEQCKANQNEKGMRRIWIKREQETHPKLTCSCLLSLLSHSLVSSPLRSMEPASSLLCDSPNGCLSPVRLPPRISFFSHVSIFHRKPLCPLLHVPFGGYLHHQHGVSAPLQLGVPYPF